MAQLECLGPQLLQMHLVRFQCGLLLGIRALLSLVQPSSVSVVSLERTFFLILSRLKNLAFLSRQIMHEIQLGMLLQVLELHESKIIL